MNKFVITLKRIVGQNSFLFCLLYFMVKNKYRVVNKNTQFVLEGFPRCANTFSYVALKDVHPNMNIAHHLHLPVQIILGVKRKIPVVVLIREPKEAILSLLLRDPSIDLDSAIRNYVSFYKIAIKFRDDIIVANFKDVIVDFNIIIAEINLKFNIGLEEFDMSPSNIQKCQKLVKKMDKIDTGLPAVNTSTVGLPTREKELRKLQLLQKYKDIDMHLTLANEIYRSLIYNK